MYRKRPNHTYGRNRNNSANNWAIVSGFSDVQVLSETSPIFSPNDVFQVFIVLDMYKSAWNIDREVDKTTSDDTVLVLRFTMKLTMKFSAIF